MSPAFDSDLPSPLVNNRVIIDIDGRVMLLLCACLAKASVSYYKGPPYNLGVYKRRLG